MALFQSGTLFSAHQFTLQFYEQPAFQTVFRYRLYTLPNVNFSLSYFNCFLDSSEIKKTKHTSTVFYEKEVAVVASMVPLQVTAWAYKKWVVEACFLNVTKCRTSSLLTSIISSQNFQIIHRIINIFLYTFLRSSIRRVFFLLDKLLSTSVFFQRIESWKKFRDLGWTMLNINWFLLPSCVFAWELEAVNTEDSPQLKKRQYCMIIGIAVV